MKRFLFPVLIALLLGTATAGAGTFENTSAVGQVPDRVLITVKAGTTLSLDKSAGTPRVGIAALDAVAAKFSVNNMEPLYFCIKQCFNTQCFDFRKDESRLLFPNEVQQCFTILHIYDIRTVGDKMGRGIGIFIDRDHFDT